MPEFDGPYEVGYGKPPRSGQFAKGRSGNPKGRPKGSKNLASVILRESRQPGKITGPHGSRTVSKIEATLMQVGNKAAQGDLRAAREFIPLIERAEEAAGAESTPVSVHELDHKMMQSLLRRLRSTESVPAVPTEDKDAKE